MTEANTKSRVLDLIAEWGADLLAWPEAERAAAKALIDQHPDQFSEALAEARALDAALASLDVPRLAPELEAAIIASAPQAAAKRPSPLRWRRLVPAGAFASLALGFGASLGAAAAAQTDQDSTEAAIELFAFDNDPYASEAD